MKEFDTKKWLRANIRDLKAYSSARDEYAGEAMVFLDANENPNKSELNRYPDPHQDILKRAISEWLQISQQQLFLGNGSDEAIDLLIRASCEPGIDRIIAISPSYGMYQVCADIQGVPVDKVLLNQDFSLNSEKVIQKITGDHKLIFLCSPNNPSGNLLKTSDIEKILASFNGVVIVDEAYIDFSNTKGLIELLDRYNNLVLLRTFSKAWGLAGARCGMAIGNYRIIEAISKIKYPYNLNTLTQKTVLDKLSDQIEIRAQLGKIIHQRTYLVQELNKIDAVLDIYPSEANFVLIRTKNADEIYQALLEEGVVVRNRNNQDLCEGCLRLTIGTEEENRILLNTLQKTL